MNQRDAFRLLGKQFAREGHGSIIVNGHREEQAEDNDLEKLAKQ